MKVIRCSLITFAVAMAACGSPSTPTPAGYKLSGTILQQGANGMIPAAGVLVEETSRNLRSMTDERGRYAIYGLPAGVAHVRIDFTFFERIDRDVQVSSDTVADFELIPLPPVTLSGRITEMTPTGSMPVSGVQVAVLYCTQSTRTMRVNEAQTDAEGFYRITGLCEGQAIVYLDKAGYAATSPNVPPCDGDGVDCRWITLAGETRFDEVMAKR